MESENENINEIKMIVIGDSGVGKTNLINTSIGIDFLENNNSTVSGSFISKQFIINDKKYNVNIWDTAGQEQYRSITKLFFKGSEIVILVYDITKPETFDSLDTWYSMCQDIIGNEVVYGVVGNKIDLYLQEQVLEEDAQKFAEAINAKFKIVSAKERPKEFVDFLKQLVIDYKSLDNIERRDSIILNKIEYIDNNNNKKSQKACC
jgi:small GTP-binding protein